MALKDSSGGLKPWATWAEKLQLALERPVLLAALCISVLGGKKRDTLSIPCRSKWCRKWLCQHSSCPWRASQEQWCAPSWAITSRLFLVLPEKCKDSGSELRICSIIPFVTRRTWNSLESAGIPVVKLYILQVLSKSNFYSTVEGHFY